MEEKTHHHYLRPKGKGLKLHLGCGDYWFDGFINIDLHVYGGTDMLLDITKELPFRDETVAVIEAYDVVEHFTREEIDIMLKDWYRMLIDGGEITIIVPDTDQIIKQYTEATDQEKKEKVLEYIYGFSNTDGQSHYWGYTGEGIKALFEKHGFEKIEVLSNYLDHRPTEPKLKLTCQKKAK